jgi:hypothetical protein
MSIWIGCGALADSLLLPDRDFEVNWPAMTLNRESDDERLESHNQELFDAGARQRLE